MLVLLSLPLSSGGYAWCMTSESHAALEAVNPLTGGCLSQGCETEGSADPQTDHLDVADCVDLLFDRVLTIRPDRDGGSMAPAAPALLCVLPDATGTPALVTAPHGLTGESASGEQRAAILRSVVILI